MFEFTAENTVATPGARPAVALTQRLCTEQYAAFLAAQPAPKEKTPSDSLAAAVASTVKKLGTATPEARADRLHSIESVLHEKLGKGGTGNTAVASSVLGAVAKAMGTTAAASASVAPQASEASHGGRKRRREAEKVHTACQKRMTALKVADHELLSSVHALYGLATAPAARKKPKTHEGATAVGATASDSSASSSADK
jgi:hypothetical protein